MKLELEPSFPIAYSSSLYGRKITFTAPSALKVMSGDHLNVATCTVQGRVDSALPSCAVFSAQDLTVLSL